MTVIHRRSLAALGVLAVVATGCSAQTKADTQAVAYNDGPFSAPTFDKCIGPAQREGQGPSDTAYFYPANQRIDRFTGGDNADFGAITVSDKDGFQIGIPGSVRFTMTKDCDKLQRFHELIGNRNSAYFNEAGTESDGWVPAVLEPIIHDAVRGVLQDEASAYTWTQINSDEAVRRELEKRLAERLPASVDRKTEGIEGVFGGYTVELLVPQLPDDLRAKLAESQTRVAQAAADRAEAEAKLATEQANTKLATEEALQRKATIAGFPNIEAYLVAYGIENGVNLRQPTIVTGGAAVPPPAK